MDAGKPRLLIVEDEKLWQEFALRIAEEAGFVPVGPVISLSELREMMPDLDLKEGDAALVDGSFYSIPPNEQYPNGLWNGGLGKEAARELKGRFPALGVIAWSSSTPNWAPQGMRVSKEAPATEESRTWQDLLRILRGISQDAPQAP